MPRKSRFYLPDVPAHIVQRGNARQAVFFDLADRATYLDCLQEGTDRYGCILHAYVLMTNHVHLLLTPSSADSISRTIQHVGRTYVSHINRKYRRSGTLWEGRHKGALIHSEQYALACYRYIEMNPVRAGMVTNPSEYRWSSYRANAFGESTDWIRPIAEYMALGMNPEERQAAYRELFRLQLGANVLDEIRNCTQSGTPMGNRTFQDHVQTMLGRFVGHSRRGRPVGSSNKEHKQKRVLTP